jgi:hypothetical protein
MATSGRLLDSMFKHPGTIRSEAPNQAMQPTAGRPDASL